MKEVRPDRHIPSMYLWNSRFVIRNRPPYCSSDRVLIRENSTAIILRVRFTDSRWADRHIKCQWKTNNWTPPLHRLVQFRCQQRFAWEASTN